MSESYSIEFLEGDSYLVSGAVHLNNAQLLRKAGEQHIRNASERISFDISKIENAHSVVLSVLLSWMRSAKKHDKRIRFLHIPSELYDMARVSGVDEVLSLAN